MMHEFVPLKDYYVNTFTDNSKQDSVGGELGIMRKGGMYTVTSI